MVFLCDSCRPGFGLQGNSRVTCDDNSQWPTALPKCVRVCPYPFLLFNNMLLESRSASYKEGDILTPECQDGYQIIGKLQLRCHADGHWEGLTNAEVCVKIPCSPPLPSDHLQLSAQISINSTITFRCDTGFILIGSTESTCLMDGLWSDPLPSCKLIDCGEPFHISHGKVNVSSTAYGASATYNCSVGYQLVGGHTLTCSDRSLWLPSAPVCEVIHCSSNFSTLSNGEVVFSNGTEYLSQATLICNTGHSNEGNETATCTELGLWSTQVCC